MTTEIYSSYKKLSDAVSDKIIETVKKKPRAVLCLATGKTPVLTYELLVKKSKADEIDFSRCIFIQLDEWIGLSPEVPGSCFHTLNEQLFKSLHIAAENTILFNALANDEEAECEKIKNVLKETGAIDLMLVGVGVNGHVGFNEPGTAFESAVHVSQLHSQTIERSKNYFDGKTPPGKGFTLGLSDVLHSKFLIVVADGERKANIMQQALEGNITSEIPVSIVRNHANAVVMMDEAAAFLLKK